MNSSFQDAQHNVSMEKIVPPTRRVAVGVADKRVWIFVTVMYDRSFVESLLQQHKYENSNKLNDYFPNIIVFIVNNSNTLHQITSVVGKGSCSTVSANSIIRVVAEQDVPLIVQRRNVYRREKAIKERKKYFYDNVKYNNNDNKRKMECISNKMLSFTDFEEVLFSFHTGSHLGSFSIGSQQQQPQLDPLLRSYLFPLPPTPENVVRVRQPNFNTFFFSFFSFYYSLLGIITTLDKVYINLVTIANVSCVLPCEPGTSYLEYDRSLIAAHTFEKHNKTIPQQQQQQRKGSEEINSRRLHNNNNDGNDDDDDSRFSSALKWHNIVNPLPHFQTTSTVHRVQSSVWMGIPFTDNVLLSSNENIQAVIPKKEKKKLYHFSRNNNSDIANSVMNRASDDATEAATPAAVSNNINTIINSGSGSIDGVSAQDSFYTLITSNNLASTDYVCMRPGGGFCDLRCLDITDGDEKSKEFLEKQERRGLLEEMGCYIYKNQTTEYVSISNDVYAGKEKKGHELWEECSGPFLHSHSKSDLEAVNESILSVANGNVLSQQTLLRLSEAKNAMRIIKDQKASHIQTNYSGLSSSLSSVSSLVHSSQTTYNNGICYYVSFTPCSVINSTHSGGHFYYCDDVDVGSFLPFPFCSRVGRRGVRRRSSKVQSRTGSGLTGSVSEGSKALSAHSYFSGNEIKRLSEGMFELDQIASLPKIEENNENPFFVKALAQLLEMGVEESKARWSLEWASRQQLQPPQQSLSNLLNIVVDYIFSSSTNDHATSLASPKTSEGAASGDRLGPTPQNMSSDINSLFECDYNYNMRQPFIDAVIEVTNKGNDVCSDNNEDPEKKDSYAAQTVLSSGIHAFDNLIIASGYFCSKLLRGYSAASVVTLNQHNDNGEPNEALRPVVVVTRKKVKKNNNSSLIIKKTLTPSSQINIVILDRQNCRNPGPRYHSRGLNHAKQRNKPLSSASAYQVSHCENNLRNNITGMPFSDEFYNNVSVGNDHIVELIIWQRVKEEIITQEEGIIADNHNSNNGKNADPTCVTNKKSIAIPEQVQPFQASLSYNSKSDATLLDDFFGTSSSAAPFQTSQQKTSVVNFLTVDALTSSGSTSHITKPSFLLLSPPSSPSSKQSLAIRYHYRYSRHIYLRGTVPIRWRTKVPKSLAHAITNVITNGINNVLGGNIQQLQPSPQNNKVYNNNTYGSLTKGLSPYRSGKQVLGRRSGGIKPPLTDVTTLFDTNTVPPADSYYWVLHPELSRIWKNGKSCRSQYVSLPLAPLSSAASEGSYYTAQLATSPAFSDPLRMGTTEITEGGRNLAGYGVLHGSRQYLDTLLMLLITRVVGYDIAGTTSIDLIRGSTTGRAMTLTGKRKSKKQSTNIYDVLNINNDNENSVEEDDDNNDNIANSKNKPSSRIARQEEIKQLLRMYTDVRLRCLSLLRRCGDDKDTSRSMAVTAVNNDCDGTTSYTIADAINNNVHDEEQISRFFTHAILDRNKYHRCGFCRGGMGKLSFSPSKLREGIYTPINNYNYNDEKNCNTADVTCYVDPMDRVDDDKNACLSCYHGSVDLVHLDWLRLISENERKTGHAEHSGLAAAVDELWKNVVPFLTNRREIKPTPNQRDVGGIPDYIHDDNSNNERVVNSNMNNCSVGKSGGWIKHDVATTGIIYPFCYYKPEELIKEEKTGILLANGKQEKSYDESDASTPIIDDLFLPSFSLSPSYFTTAVNVVNSPEDVIVSTEQVKQNEDLTLSTDINDNSLFNTINVQQRFLRINCADSLDRTNLVSFFTSIQVLLKMLTNVIGINIHGLNDMNAYDGGNKPPLKMQHVNHYIFSLFNPTTANNNPQEANPPRDTNTLISPFISTAASFGIDPNVITLYAQSPSSFTSASNRESQQRLASSPHAITHIINQKQKESNILVYSSDVRNHLQYPQHSLAPSNRNETDQIMMRSYGGKDKNSKKSKNELFNDFFNLSPSSVVSLSSQNQQDQRQSSLVTQNRIFSSQLLDPFDHKPDMFEESKMKSTSLPFFKSTRNNSSSLNSLFGQSLEKQFLPLSLKEEQEQPVGASAHKTISRKKKSNITLPVVTHSKYGYPYMSSWPSLVEEGKLLIWEQVERLYGTERCQPHPFLGNVNSNFRRNRGQNKLIGEEEHAEASYVPYLILKSISILFVDLGNSISRVYTASNCMHTKILRIFSGLSPHNDGKQATVILTEAEMRALEEKLPFYRKLVSLLPTTADSTFLVEPLTISEIIRKKKLMMGSGYAIGQADERAEDITEMNASSGGAVINVGSIQHGKSDVWGHFSSAGGQGRASPSRESSPSGGGLGFSLGSVISSKIGNSKSVANFDTNNHLVITSIRRWHNIYADTHKNRFHETVMYRNMKEHYPFFVAEFKLNNSVNNNYNNYSPENDNTNFFLHNTISYNTFFSLKAVPLHLWKSTLIVHIPPPFDKLKIITSFDIKRAIKITWQQHVKRLRQGRDNLMAGGAVPQPSYHRDPMGCNKEVRGESTHEGRLRTSDSPQNIINAIPEITEDMLVFDDGDLKKFEQMQFEKLLNIKIQRASGNYNTNSCFSDLHFFFYYRVQIIHPLEAALLVRSRLTKRLSSSLPKLSVFSRTNSSPLSLQCLSTMTIGPSLSCLTGKMKFLKQIQLSCADNDNISNNDGDSAHNENPKHKTLLFSALNTTSLPYAYGDSIDSLDDDVASNYSADEATSQAELVSNDTESSDSPDVKRLFPDRRGTSDSDDANLEEGNSSAGSSSLFLWPDQDASNANRVRDAISDLNDWAVPDENDSCTMSAIRQGDLQEQQQLSPTDRRFFSHRVGTRNYFLFVVFIPVVGCMKLASDSKCLLLQPSPLSMRIAHPEMKSEELIPRWITAGTVLNITNTSRYDPVAVLLSQKALFVKVNEEEEHSSPLKRIKGKGSSDGQVQRPIQCPLQSYCYDLGKDSMRLERARTMYYERMLNKIQAERYRSSTAVSHIVAHPQQGCSVSLPQVYTFVYHSVSDPPYFSHPKNVSLFVATNRNIVIDSSSYNKNNTNNLKQTVGITSTAFSSLRDSSSNTLDYLLALSCFDFDVAEMQGQKSQNLYGSFSSRVEQKPTRDCLSSSAFDLTCSGSSLIQDNDSRQRPYYLVVVHARNNDPLINNSDGRKGTVDPQATDGAGGVNFRGKNVAKKAVLGIKQGWKALMRM